MSEPLVLCVAPNGARLSQRDHPALPLNAAELATQAARCREAGACALHLHVRDEQGRHSLDPGRYREAMAAIRERVGEDLALQISTEAAGRYAREEQMATVRALEPAAASVALRELMPSAADEAAAARFYAWAAANRVAIQHILYAPEEVERLVQAVRAGAIPDPAAALFVLGKFGQAAGDPRSLPAWLRAWPVGWHWSACGFGAREAQIASAAIGLGGHVRVGFENNLLRVDGQPASGNAENVANCAAIAQRAGRAIAGPAHTLTVLGRLP